MLGSVTGLLAGQSRTAALGTVLPAVLGLVGGITVYLLGQDDRNRLLVSLSIIALSFTLFIASGWGARLREIAEDFRTSEAELKRAAFVERNVGRFRQKLGLPFYPPSRSDKAAPQGATAIED
jgi:hypothetical protein